MVTSWTLPSPASTNTIRAERGRCGCPERQAVISLFMSGGVSHVDTFDYKPALTQYAGQPMAESVVVRSLQALADAGEIDPGLVQKAFDRYKVDDPTATRGVEQEGGDA